MNMRKTHRRALKYIVPQVFKNPTRQRKYMEDRIARVEQDDTRYRHQMRGPKSLWLDWFPQAA